MRCGQVSVRRIGLAEDVRSVCGTFKLDITDYEILQGHHAVVINVLHPGFFAYNPAYQRQLFDLMLLEGALLNIANAYVGGRPGDPITTKEKAQAYKQDILEIAERIGLSAILQERRRSVYQIVSALHSLRAISRCVSIQYHLGAGQ